MEDLEWKFNDLSAMLSDNAVQLAFAIEAHRINDHYSLFILFYKWINSTSAFLASTHDKQTFERVNVESFQTFFMEHNPDWEKYMPPYETMSAFFWQVCNFGFLRHFEYIEKRYPEIFKRNSL